MTQIAFVFPGQGSQKVGMGRDWAERFDAAAQVFAEADEVLGFSLSRLCWEGPAEDLQLTANTQPAILACSVAMHRVVAAAGLTPVALAGHSLGEYSALVAAGALDFATACKLVRRRGELMQEAVPVGVGAMAALMGLDADAVTAVAEGHDWSTIKNAVPSCDAANTQRILKTAFVCDHATMQIDGIGIYNGRMAQYRDGGSGFLSIFLGLSKDRWQNLEPGNETDMVECRKDRKEHGDIKVGGGPVISRGAVANPELVRRLRKAAESSDTAVQLQASPAGSGTDADNIHTSRAGVATSGSCRRARSPAGRSTRRPSWRRCPIRSTSRSMWTGSTRHSAQRRSVPNSVGSTTTRCLISSRAAARVAGSSAPP